MIQLKKGTLEVSDEHWGYAERGGVFLDRVRLILGRDMNYRLAGALLKVLALKEFNSELFLKQLEGNPRFLRSIGSGDAYVRAIDETYNFGIRGKSRVPLEWLIRQARLAHRSEQKHGLGKKGVA
jgi:hypothetical protein